MVVFEVEAGVVVEVGVEVVEVGVVVEVVVELYKFYKYFIR